MTRFKYKLLCVTLLFSSSVYAESPCRTLAKQKAFDAPTLPFKADDDTQEKILATMHNIEVFCTAIVKKVKTEKGADHDIREKMNSQLVEAQEKYDKDGDLDNLETTKYLISIAYSSLDIAEKYH